jgi:hypothetical protein
MMTAVLGEAADDTGIVYSAKLIGLGAHYGSKPRVCKAYRTKTGARPSDRFATCGPTSFPHAASPVSRT